jgi:hypothetical protein
MSSLVFVQTAAHEVSTRLRSDDFGFSGCAGRLNRGEPVFVLETHEHMSKVLCRLGVRWLMNSWVGIT